MSLLQLLTGLIQDLSPMVGCESNLTFSNGVVFSNASGEWTFGQRQSDWAYPERLAAMIGTSGEADALSEAIDALGVTMSLRRTLSGVSAAFDGRDLVGTVAIDLRTTDGQCDITADLWHLLARLRLQTDVGMFEALWQALTTDPLPADVAASVCARHLAVQVQPALDFAMDVIMQDRHGSAGPIVDDDATLLEFLQQKHGVKACVLTRPESWHLVVDETGRDVGHYYITFENGLVWTVSDSLRTQRVPVDPRRPPQWAYKSRLTIPVDDIRDSLSTCAGRLLAVWLVLCWDDETISHANVLFFDRHLQIVRRFEPNGPIPFYEYRTQVLDSVLAQVISREFGFVYKGVDSLSCPGLQSAQSDEEGERLPTDPSGFCAAWGLFMIDFRMSNPDLDQEDASWAATAMLSDRPETFTDFIRRYALYVLEKSAALAALAAENQREADEGSGSELEAWSPEPGGGRRRSPIRPSTPFHQRDGD